MRKSIEDRFEHDRIVMPATIAALASIVAFNAFPTLFLFKVSPAAGFIAATTLVGMTYNTFLKNTSNLVMWTYSGLAASLFLQARGLFNAPIAGASPSVAMTR